jgi:hypothetical protein
MKMSRIHETRECSQANDMRLGMLELINETNAFWASAASKGCRAIA